MRISVRVIAATLAGVVLAGTGAYMAAANPVTRSRWRIAFAASSIYSDFTGIAALSARNVWAVGTNQPPGPIQDQTMTIRRWDGRAWIRVSLPATYRHAYLFTVAGSTSANVWVFGQWRNSKGLDGHLFALRWNGQRWMRTGWWPGYNQVSAAVVLSRTDVWMFSQGTWHYNGHGWKAYKLPFDLVQASAISGNDIWAVGSDNVTSGPVLARWHDGRWAAEPLPQLASSAVFTDLIAPSDGDIWVVGATGTTKSPALSLRRHDGVWTRYKVRALASFGAVVADGHGGLWATFNGFAGAGVAQFSSGSWHLVRLPTVTGKGTGIQELSRVPGSGTVYAAGALFFGGYPNSNAAVLRYGP